MSYPTRRGPWWLMEQAFDDEMARAAWPRGWGRRARQQEQGWAPATDLYDKADRLVLKVELPGVPEDQIEITLEKGILTLRGERPRDEEVAEDEWLCCERAAGKFYRAIQLPSEVNANEISATYAHGVLTIVLPKTVEEQTRKIDVKAAE